MADELLELGKLGSHQFMSPEIMDRSLKAKEEDLRIEHEPIIKCM